RLARYGGRYNLIPKGLTITSARTRYGSCSASNRISLTWRLVMAPYSVIDYVILHELAHIKIKNHSRQFWDFLETMVSDYRDRRLWLREHGRLLVI
ncbi:MAG TPA: M48 family metallopeptidase, partial [Syntrophorhabdaceae bacterium]